jgi:predicted nucleic acid-binding protein
MDRVFLDASVLYAAAARPGSAIERLWTLSGVRLITANQSADEALRNLESAALRERLTMLLRPVDVRADPAPGAMRMVARELYNLDAPAVVSAIAAKATHLITADLRRFGEWIGKSISGVIVVKPSSYLC